MWSLVLVQLPNQRRDRPDDFPLPHRIEARREWHGRDVGATDTKLGRDVAIKILLEAFAADRDRMVKAKGTAA